MILCEIFITVGAFMRILDKAQKKRKLGVVDECREESKSCIDVKLKFALC